MELSEVLRLVAGAIGGLAAIWGTWSKLWGGKLGPWLRRRRIRRRLTANLATYRQTAHAIEAWRAEHDAMRGLCLSASNCGSDWDPSKPVEVGVVSESEKNEVPQVFDRWNGWRADPPYRDLLYDVIQAGETGHFITTETMKRSELRDYYRQQGTVCSIVFFLHFTLDSELIYVSLNFGEPLGDRSELPPDIVQKWIQHAEAIWTQGEPVRAMHYAGAAVWAKQ